MERTVKCPVCGEPYKFYSYSAADQSAYKMKCRYCKAVFEFTKSETNVVFDQRDGKFMQLKCPCCSKDLTCNV